MSLPTQLDQAHARMEADPSSDAARLRFYERLSDCELFLMLDKEVEGETIEPALFDTPDGRFVLVFDREERLAEFAGRAVPYAGLSGRGIVQMLAGQDIGIGVNLEVAPSAMLIPPQAVSWLQETLGHAPHEVEAEVESFLPPKGLPEAFLTALDAKLATAAGLAQAAYLVGVTYHGGGRGHLLGIIDAKEGAQSALAKAVSEALTFSGIEAGALDVGFFAGADTAAASLARVGLRFELPQPQEAQVYQPSMPGSDPDKPPRLK
ncbi:SseB family protein [Phycobacter azelaicus]|uniref:SseB family protein n=1 Tax=Phycobacter azelaicus TaxID=2668075 RepID=UPI0018689B14|nr:SseB family protein [Phycobacter azelaicus]MBE1296581.1 SseB family protein [Paracoccaceae bacterium]